MKNIFNFFELCKKVYVHIKLKQFAKTEIFQKLNSRYVFEFLN